MKVRFIKYQGTGNDFILLDGRSKSFKIPSETQIASLCDRKFGIGADGLIIIIKSKTADFEMLYYNADGREGSMCGNGGRCTIAFAQHLGIIKNQTSFKAYDGPHEGSIDSKGKVTLKMSDVRGIKKIGKDLELNTGSPHYISFKRSIKNIDVYEEGRKIRYNETYRKSGINVNFVEIQTRKLLVRTYERGVEDETLSCGTGVTAAAIAYASLDKKKNIYNIAIQTPGGNLTVSFKTKDHQHFSDIYLKGPATQVFHGKITI